ncbi:ATPase [soil metagenome]
MSSNTILCLASYFKGGRFVQECKRQHCHTILLTQEKFKDEAWPRDVIDEFFLLPSLNKQPDITHAVSYLARERKIDRIVALDDYDVEIAAALREHLRIPGMGDTTARYFRDKLAMRVQAQEKGIPVPEFVPVINYDQLREFMARVPAPWVLKPRSEASSMGIKKIHDAEELWRSLDNLGDRQSFYVLEKFVPGDVYHVDSIVSERKVLYAIGSKYGLPPMTVYQGGGVFVTSTLPYGSDEDQALQAINREVIGAMGMVRGVTHAEFIRGHADGRFYFLEIAARVGGANIDLMVEHATGFNLWAEWAKIELCHLRSETYELPEIHQRFAGLIVSLARQETPDTSAYNEPEIAWRLDKKHHVGLILAAEDYGRVQTLIGEYAARITADFSTSAPPLDKPPV